MVMYAAAPGWSRVTVKPPKLVLTVQARIKVDILPGQYAYGHSSAYLRDLREVTFSPDVINVGTVRISIVNFDDEGNALEIDGVTSAPIGPDGRTAIRVTFKRPGVYPITLENDNLMTPFSGALKVLPN
jgi:hypothetical protein